MKKIECLNIKSLLLHCTSFGTGFIPTDQKKWWFAIGNKKYWKTLENGQLMISFTSIGGHVEQNESFIEATLREINEETGVEAKIEDSHETRFIRSILVESSVFDFQIESIEEMNIVDKPKPFLIYSLKQENDILGVVVYQGKFVKEPYPNAEVPALICLSPELLTKCPTSLDSLLNFGAKLREKYDRIPRDAIIYPFGSAKIVQALPLEK